MSLATLAEATYLAREAAAQADPDTNLHPSFYAPTAKETASAAYGKTATIPDDFDACTCVSEPNDICFAETHIA